MVYRGRLEIIYDLLTAIDRKAPHCSKYEMQKGSRTAYWQMAKYLDWVIADKLVVEEQRLHPQLEPTYKLTENGKRFIELINELRAFLYVSSFAQTRYQP